MRRLFLAALVFLFFFPLCAAAQECIDCHEKYQRVDHAKLKCVACHSDAKDLPHAEKLKKPECASCHRDAVREHGTSVHAGKGLTCKSCHNVHTPRGQTKRCVDCHTSVAHRKLPSARKHLAEMNCAGCHAKTAQGHIDVKVESKQMVTRDVLDKDGNKSVDEKEWKDFLAHAQSVVGNGFRIKRVYSATGSAHSIGPRAVSCNGCHVENKVFRKAMLEMNTGGQRTRIALDLHSVIPRLPIVDTYRLTAHGKGGVACSDCHVSQKRIDDHVCAKCHDKVYGVYKGTAHAKGGATKCTDCHDPHKVKTYRELGAAERVAVCARCHGDYIKQHRWLPHAELHFMYLECSTCHSPLSKKSMVFHINLQTKDGKRRFTRDDITAAFGESKYTRDLIDVNGDERIAPSEIIPFFEAMERTTKGTVGIEGSIVVTDIHHDYSQVQKRDKVCTTCHSNDAPFYQSMYLAVPEMEGLFYMPVKGTVLAAMPSSIALNFFLLGETKARWSDITALVGARGEVRDEIVKELGFKWIDIVGVFLSIAVLIFVCLHIVLRMVFRR